MSRYNARLIGALAIAGVIPAHAGAQSPMERMGAVRQQIVAGNAERALQMLDSLQPLVPDHPNLMFLRAHALGKAGRMSEAAEAIRSLQRRDARYAQIALRDSSVMALRRDFPDIDSLAAAASRPFSSAKRR